MSLFIPCIKLQHFKIKIETQFLAIRKLCSCIFVYCLKVEAIVNFDVHCKMTYGMRGMFSGHMFNLLICKHVSRILMRFLETDVLFPLIQCINKNILSNIFQVESK